MKRTIPIGLLIIILFSGCVQQPAEDSGASSAGGAASAGLDAKQYFCTHESCAEKLVDAYDSAETSIHVLIYSLTKDEISEALVRAEERGLDVKVVFDSQQANVLGSDINYLLANGIRTRRGAFSGLMHNKVSIIDSEYYSTGSYNYTESAESRNAENLVFIYSKDLAEDWEEEFSWIWDEKSE